MIACIMAFALLNASATVLPYAQELPYAPKELILQSSDAVQRACVGIESAIDTDLNRFVQLSQKCNYREAYEIWSDLQFRYVSFRLALGQTLHLSTSDEVKATVCAQGELLDKFFQERLLNHPALLHTFLQNGEAAASLTPQQRFFTQNILKEYQEMHLREAPQIAQVLQVLSTQKTESFAYAQGLAAPVDPNALSELNVLTANIICFPGILPYLHGGISPWNQRIDPLVQIIRNSQAEVVCLQEVWDPEAMRALVQRLKNDYSLFIYDAGDPAGTLRLNRMGYNSGLFIASKLILDGTTFYRFPRSIPEASNRGALSATCRIANQRIALINTHLQHGTQPEMLQVRQEQLFLCYASLQELISRTLSNRSWGFLCGDLNINAFSPEFNASGLPRLFSIPYTAQLSTEKATCTDYFNDLVLAPPNLRAQVPISYELLDYCIRPSLSPVAASSDQTLIPLFDLTANTEPLSDHQALLTRWRAPPPAGKDNKNSAAYKAAH